METVVITGKIIQRPKIFFWQNCPESEKDFPYRGSNIKIMTTYPDGIFHEVLLAFTNIGTTLDILTKGYGVGDNIQIIAIKDEEREKHISIPNSNVSILFPVIIIHMPQENLLEQKITKIQCFKSLKEIPVLNHQKICEFCPTIDLPEKTSANTVQCVFCNRFYNKKEPGYMTVHILPEETENSTNDESLDKCQ